MGGSLQKEDLIFSDKQCDVLTILESPNNSHISEVFYGGAAGGGKSWIGCHWQIERRMYFKGTRGLIGRESLKNLKLTTFKTFCDVWDEYYRNNPWKITWKVNWMTNVIHFSHGSEIVLMDLGYYPSDPEYHRLGSLEISDAFIDELPEIRQKCFEILQSRIRYKLDMVGPPKCLATGNPSLNWVKERYIKTVDGKEVTLKPHQSYVRATVHDNPNEEFKRVYISALEKLSPNDRLRLLEGEWDINLNENPWCWSLNVDDHCKPEVYEVNPNYMIILSFDFNHDPCALVVGQYEQHLPRFNVVGYYKASSDRESAIKQLCDIVKREYPQHTRTKKLIVTGDASGKQRDASRPSNMNRYTDICRHLGLNEHGSVKIEVANTSHKASRDLCNDSLHQLKGGYYFWGGRGTEMLIQEIQSTYPDEKESLNRAKKELGLHGLDAWRYLNQYWFAHRLRGNQFRDYKRKIEGIKRRIRSV